MNGRERIFINASTVLISGGLIISQNIINALIQDDSFDIIITCPAYKPYRAYVTDNSKLIVVPHIMLNRIFRWYHDYFWLPAKIRRFNPTLVFTLSNLPACTAYRQLYLHDNPYVTERDYSYIKIPAIDRITHYFRRILTLNRLKYVDHIIVQTPYQKQAFSRIYKHEVPISVLSPGIPEHLSARKSFNDKQLSKEYLKIACVSRYFSHKNLEVLYETAKFCDIHNVSVQIILTISPTENYHAKQLIKRIEKNSYNNRIINIGRRKKKEISDLISKVDALILPSFLETYGLNCIEAWYHEKPIFVSDIESLRSSCGDAAFYFNPYSSESIVNTISNAFDNPDLISMKINSGKSRLKELHSWSDYVRLIQQVV